MAAFCGSCASHGRAEGGKNDDITPQSDHNVPFDEQNRNLFAFAAYDTGPEKIQSLRRQAEAEKLDPNVWFNNVERVAAAGVGQEPVRYVRNIYKYYIAFKLIEEAEASKKAAIAGAATGPAAADTSAPPQPTVPH
jgi:membrane-bound lytic murein transglycosylase MltF